MKLKRLERSFLLEFNESELSGDEIATMRNHILMAIHVEKESSTHFKKTKENERFSFFSIMRWAAIIIFPLSLVGVGYYFFGSGSLTRPAITNNTPVDSTTQKVVNQKGQKSVFLLADG